MVGKPRKTSARIELALALVLRAFELPQSVIETVIKLFGGHHYMMSNENFFFTYMFTYMRESVRKVNYNLIYRPRSGKRCFT